MDAEQLRQLIVNELPGLMRSDKAFQATILDITRAQFADKTETDSRFSLMMAKQDRSMDKWNEHNLALTQLTKALDKLTKNVDKLEQRLDRKIAEDRQKGVNNQQHWEENHKQITALTSALQSLELRFNQKVEEDRQKWAENEQRWQENHKQITALTSALQSLELRFNQKAEEDRQKWAANEQRWEVNEQCWAENKQQWANNHQEMAEVKQAISKFEKTHSRVEQRIGAMGARWGTQSEASFRNALAGILKEFSDVQVLHVDEHDEEGIVFGHPEEVELDLIIKDGLLIIGEIKSSASKSDISIFNKKVHFYEQKHHRQANRKMVISPMVDERALSLAKKLDIEVYSFAEDVVL